MIHEFPNLYLEDKVIVARESNDRPTPIEELENWPTPIKEAEVGSNLVRSRRKNKRPIGWDDYVHD